MEGQSLGLLAGASFKKFVIIGSSVVAVVAIPVTVVSVGRDQGDKIWSGLTSSTVGTKIADFFTNASEYVEKFPEKIGTAGKTDYEKVSKIFSENSTSKPLKEQANNSTSFFKKAYNWVKSDNNLKDANFYFVNVGNAVKSLIRYVPTIIRDSIRDLYYDSVDPENKKYELFSIQRIVNLASNSGFSNFVKELKELGVKRKNIFSQLNEEESSDFIRVISAVIAEEKAEITKHLNKFTENIKKIVDTDTFKNAKELLIRILLGDQKDQKTNELSTQLSTQLENSKDKAEENIKAVVTEVVEVLKKFAGSEDSAKEAK